MSVNVVFAIVCLSCALILISHCRYEEGLVGRAALLLLIVAESVVLAQAWHGDSYVLAPTTLLGHFAVALFLTRHTYKFLSFYYFGRYHWDKRATDEKEVV